MPKVLITGAAGFLGRHVTNEFLSVGYGRYPAGPNEIFTPSSAQVDLLDFDSTHQYVRRNRIDSIVHLAAVCGGIGINAERPGDFIRDNLVMGINILEVARLSRLKKVVLLGTVCMYPKFTPVPFHENDLWNGYPEETNAPYGVAKKAVMEMGNAYRRQFGLNTITLIPVNMAGEFDHFGDDRSHVIPALVAKMANASSNGSDSVTLWGDGSASREFLYAGDCARAIRMAYESYDGELPINVGTGFEITIRELAEKVAQRVGFRGTIVWDDSKPNGQPRRCLDVSRARELIGFEAEVSLDEILDRVVDYYRSKV